MAITREQADAAALVAYPKASVEQLRALAIDLVSKSQLQDVLRAEEERAAEVAAEEKAREHAQWLADIETARDVDRSRHGQPAVQRSGHPWARDRHVTGYPQRSATSAARPVSPEEQRILDSIAAARGRS